MHSSPSAARRALTLLEVLVSLAIFLFSLAALTHLINLASYRALEARQRQEAAFLAQSKLTELSVGALPLSSQAETPVDDQSGWLWAVDATQGDVEGMWRVEVRVQRQRPDGSVLQVALQQIMLDPKLRGSSSDPPPGGDPPPESDMSNSQNQQNSSSSSSTQTPGTAASNNSKTGGGSSSSIPTPRGLSAPSSGGATGGSTKGGGKQ